MPYSLLNVGDKAAELIRIVQEALTNVQKHADATVVRVNAEWGRSAFELSVADNGRGFDPSALDGSSFGIRGMHERAGLIGGEVEIVSRSRDGTRVVIRVPGGESNGTGRKARQRAKRGSG